MATGALAVQRAKVQEEEEEARGFSFELCRRNDYLARQGVKFPRTRKTGTTIAGTVFQGGVVLGADTRATNGSIVADKDCDKIHVMAPNIAACGAGTAADTAFLTEMVSRQLELHRYASGRQSRVVTALTILKSHLFSHQGHIQAALVLGGMDGTGAHLYTVYPHGSTDRLPFGAMGSGSLAAMAQLESGYKDNLSRDEAVALVARAIRAGIFNDLGSGSNVDIAIITKDGMEHHRSFEQPNPRTYRAPAYHFAHGTTTVLASRVQELKKHVVVAEGDTMEE